MRIIPDYYIMVERSRAGSVYWKKAGTAGLERTRAGWQEIQAAHESGFSMISCRETTIYEKDRFFSFPSTVKASRVAGSFTVPLYVLSIPVTSWSEMTVGVSAVSSQLHILHSLCFSKLSQPALLYFHPLKNLNMKSCLLSYLKLTLSVVSFVFKVFVRTQVILLCVLCKLKTGLVP